MKKSFSPMYILVHLIFFTGLGLFYVAYSTYIRTEDFFALSFKTDYYDESTYISNPILEICLLLLFGSICFFISHLILTPYYLDKYKSIKKKFNKKTNKRKRK